MRTLGCQPVPHRLHCATASVTAASRRVWLYWILLLLPALAVGVGTVLLLRREQARLDVQNRLAAETRLAAVTARAQLSAENIALLLADVQSGLMQTLREVPERDAAAFVGEWRESNPFVRDVFRRSAHGSVEWGGDAGRRWLATEPWADGGVMPPPPPPDSADQTAANVLQYQRARAELQDAAQNRRVATAAPSAAVAAKATRERRVPDPERTGWTTWQDGADTRVFGWRRWANGTVDGVELMLDAVWERSRDIMPAATETERYVLRRVPAGGNAGGHVPSVRGDELVVVAALPPDVLAGWEVAAFVRRPGGTALGEGALLGLGGLLVMGLILAIAGSGALLLRDARRSEAEAAQKTSFVANVSHELKTPLTTIRLYAELLEQERVREPAQRLACLGTIGREAERLGRLVNNVLDFSRLEQGKKTYVCEELDLRKEVGHWLDAQAPRFTQLGVALRRHLPDAAVRVKTDRDAVQQIMLNLLDNAAKYGATGPEVLVTLMPGSGGGAELRVADRGPGVPAPHREKIFERFHRVDESLTAAQSGAGLGLTIARALARGLGGDLRCLGRPGGGVEFVLSLPS